MANMTGNTGIPAWDNPQWETILVQYFNSLKCTSFVGGMSSKKAISVKELGELTCNAFKEIIRAIFQDSMTPKLQWALETKELVTDKTNAFGELIPNYKLAFDPQPYALFESLRRFFPADVDLLRPCVILNPRRNPMRTRRVLRYLTAVVVFAEEYTPEFYDIQYEVERKHVEKEALSSQLKTTKEDINKMLINLDNWKTQLELLKRDAIQKTEDLQKLERKSADVDSKVREAEKTYNELLNQKNYHDNELQKIKREVEEKSKLVVASSDKIIADLQIEQQRLQDLNNERDACGQKLSQCSQRTSQIEKVVVEASTVISYLHEVVLLLSEAVDVMDSLINAQAVVDKKLSAARVLESGVQALQSELLPLHENSSHIDDRSEALRAKMKQYQMLNENNKKLNEDLKRTINRIASIKNAIQEKKMLTNAINENIQEANAYLEGNLPQLQTQWKDYMNVTIAAIKQEFEQQLAYCNINDVRNNNGERNPSRSQSKGPRN